MRRSSRRCWGDAGQRCQLFESWHLSIQQRYDIGNGRIGRLLISLLTVHWNLLPLPLLYLSAYFEQNRSEYYDLLLAVSQKGAWQEWLEFFLRGVDEQAQDAARRARALLEIQQQWRERLGGQRSANLLRLADMLLERPVLTIPEAQRMLDVTYPTARNQVEKLATVGILTQLSDSNYGKLYAAVEILEILE
jgi:Fic family protein